MHRRRAPLLGPLALALTILAPAAHGDTDVLGHAGHLTGMYPPVMEKVEDTTYVDATGVGGSGVSLRSAEHAVQTATAAASGATAYEPGCLPYSVYAYVWFMDQLGRQMFYDQVRFPMQWCEDRVVNIGAAEGTCQADTWVPYRGGVGRCWWTKGLWGGTGFSFQTGADYHYRFALDPVTAPRDHITVTLGWSGSWYGPGTEPVIVCPSPEDLPEGWILGGCNIDYGSDW